MPTYRLVALGCKVSRADAASIERTLRGAGFTAASSCAKGGETADLCVVCGCAVTAVAEGKSRRAIRRLARENPGATVVAAGCIGKREATSREAGAGLLVAPEDVAGLLDRLREMDRWRDVRPGTGCKPEGFPGRTRAFLKVQDGCDGGCTYCMVPQLRGGPRSVPVPQVMDEARRLLRSGHAEIVLAGVRLGAYSHDSTSLTGLVEKLLSLGGPEGRGPWRLRLSSMEPMDLRGADEALAAIAASSTVLCPHFHLPVQSGDDHILARMNRPYRVSDFRALVERLRLRIEDPAITTDVMAGFPGETEEAHARSVELIEKLGFARVHAFPFSPRPGTAAAEMPHEPGTEIARLRTAEVIDAGQRTAREFRRRFVGKAVSVLAEPGAGPGRLAGYTERYVRVTFHGPEEIVGKLVRVQNLVESDGALEGELAE